MAMQNTELWKEVFTKNLSEVFTRKLDMNSEHLDRDTPLKMDRLLTADFICGNRLQGKKGVCGKKWDSTSVTVTFQYEVEFNGFSKFMNHGIIQIEEYKQRCKRCSQSQSFATPILDYESADRAAKKLKQKILEKFYGESPQEFPDSSHGRKERKKPHDQANCEACLKGKCAANERRRGGGKGWGQEREVSAVVRRGPKIGKWILKINHSREEIEIGYGQKPKDKSSKNNNQSFQPNPKKYKANLSRENKTSTPKMISKEPSPVSSSTAASNKSKTSSSVNSLTQGLSQLTTKSTTNKETNQTKIADGNPTVKKVSKNDVNSKDDAIVQKKNRRRRSAKKRNKSSVQEN